MSNSSIDKPILAGMYEYYTRQIYNKRIYVAKKNWPKFARRENLLAEFDIDFASYTISILTLDRYMWLASTKGWDFLPVNVFLGAKAMEHWVELEDNFATAETAAKTKIRRDKAELLDEEIKFAQEYLYNYTHDIPVPRSAGLGDNGRPVEEALDVLCGINQVPRHMVKHYIDLGDIIKERNMISARLKR